MRTSAKLAFIGDPNAGKSTCIAAISDIPPVVTDVGCTDDLADVKQTTTAALDYGEVGLGEQGRLLLYGLPCQARFRFMFDVIREGLLGIVLLVDASAPHGLRGLEETLETYVRELREFPFVLAPNKSPGADDALKSRCLDLLRGHRLVAPICTVDARRKADIVRLAELIFLMLDLGGRAPASGDLVWA